MLTDLDRKILTKACGLCWHECDLVSSDRAKCGRCGEYFNVEDTFLGMSLDYNPTFTTPDDWELVRVKVVREYIFEFTVYLIGLHYGTVETVLRWWLTLPPEQCNQLAADFIKTNPDLFPWVVDFIAEIAEKKMPTGSAQIASGKGMPWVVEMMEGKG